MAIRWRPRGLLAFSLPAVVVAFAASCAQPADALTLPTDSRIGSTDGDMGALQGRLRGERSGDGAACFWIGGPNGCAFLVLREGSYATADLALHPSGAELQALEIGETYLFSGAPDLVAPRGCPGDGVGPGVAR